MTIWTTCKKNHNNLRWCNKNQANLIIIIPGMKIMMICHHHHLMITIIIKKNPDNLRWCKSMSVQSSSDSVASSPARPKGRYYSQRPVDSIWQMPNLLQMNSIYLMFDHQQKRIREKKGLQHLPKRDDQRSTSLSCNILKS